MVKTVERERGKGSIIRLKQRDPKIGERRRSERTASEVSRLARNSTDWHRLLEICAITDTLILDEDGIYHPAEFNDRLLLGLKGSMSEAELHLIRARMRGGLLNKAKRGELATPLPFGFAYDDEGRVVLDPNQQIQHAIRSVFDAFRRVGSVCKKTRKLMEKRSAVREGPSLLQGLAICGVCGSRMTVGYRQRKAGLAPFYICQGPREVESRKLPTLLVKLFRHSQSQTW